MKAIFYLSIFLFVSFLLSPNCSAEMVDLGSFTQQELRTNLETGLTVTVKDQAITIPPPELTSWLEEAPTLSYVKNYKSEIENGNLCAYKKSLLCKLAFSYRQESGLKKKISVTLDIEQVKNSIAKLAVKINKDPSDSRLKVENGKVSLFSLSEKGLKLDEEKSLGIIVAAMENKTAETKVDLPYWEPEPTLTADSIDNMGVDTLIGEGHSNFRGSPKNRILNINVATDRFNGILIRPGEEFSFVKVLGEVDGEHGYLPELVIKQDKT